MADATPAAPNAAAPAATSETPVEGAAAPEVAKHTPNPDVRKFAALTKKERGINAKELENKTRAAKYAAIENDLRAAKQNPDAALKALGLSYEDITKYYLSERTPDDPTTIAKKAQERAEAAERKMANWETQQNQQRVVDLTNKTKAAIREHIQATKADHATVEALGNDEDVWELISLRYDQESVNLSAEERNKLARELMSQDGIAAAAKLLEETSFEQETTRFVKLLAVPKFKDFVLSKLQAVPADKADKKSADKLKTTPKATAIEQKSETVSTEKVAMTRVQRQQADEQKWKELMSRAGAKVRKG